MIVQGQAGERQIPFTDFHRLPGDAPERDNVLDRGDLIVAIEVPEAWRRAHHTTLRSVTARPMSSRWSLRRPRSRLDGGRIGSARLAMGGVAHKPWRLTAVETVCAEFRWTTSTGSGRRLRHRSSMPVRSLTMPSRSSWRSVSRCVHCKPREPAYERRRTTDLTH